MTADVTVHTDDATITILDDIVDKLQDRLRKHGLRIHRLDCTRMCANLFPLRAAHVLPRTGLNFEFKFLFYDRPFDLTTQPLQVTFDLTAVRLLLAMANENKRARRHASTELARRSTNAIDLEQMLLWRKRFAHMHSSIRGQSSVHQGSIACSRIHQWCIKGPLRESGRERVREREKETEREKQIEREERERERERGRQRERESERARERKQRKREREREREGEKKKYTQMHTRYICVTNIATQTQKHQFEIHELLDWSHTGGVLHTDMLETSDDTHLRAPSRERGRSRLRLN